MVPSLDTTWSRVARRSNGGTRGVGDGAQDADGGVVPALTTFSAIAAVATVVPITTVATITAVAAIAGDGSSSSNAEECECNKRRRDTHDNQMLSWNVNRRGGSGEDT